MNYTQNQKIYESTSLDIINWSEIDWSKTNKYVIKQKDKYAMLNVIIIMR